MRNLASIQRIWKIEPIDGADKIELAHVLGWQCVVNKTPYNAAIWFHSIREGAVSADRSLTACSIQL